ncbi:MAG: response regulator [Cyanobacteria bacterium P01_D01_bin.56]
MLKFEAGTLEHTILNLQKNLFSGVAYTRLLHPSDSPDTLKVFNFLNGELTYGGSYLPKPYELSKQIGDKLKLTTIDAALSMASRSVKNPLSIREYLEFYTQIELFSWQDFEKIIRNQLILNLEQVLPCAGLLKLSSSTSFDLSLGQDRHGFTWESLKQEIIQRQQSWVSLSPTIPSKNVVPQRIENVERAITDQWARRHLHQWVDGQRSLADIAQHIGTDPLELAHGYFHFVQMGWLTFKHIRETQTVNKRNESTIPPSGLSSESLPTILSVDDSAIVQAMIKRAIGEHYNLLLANNAMDALNLLNQHNVDLLLLDVTMPDIDGLELCRTIRNIGKFRDLPVIMLTAKDGMFNKIKGQMAGSTQYLTKPIDRQKLFDVLKKYLPQQPEAETYVTQSNLSEQPI